MKNVEMSEATTIAEYQALRAEILLRLGFQQQLLNYSLIATGLIVPIVGLFGVTSIDPHVVLALLLIGPIVGVFLQLIYLKQYVYFQQIASYIAYRLGLAQALDISLPRDGVPVFSGWEKHLNSKLIKSRIVDSAVAFTGLAEGTFPAIGGVLYLFTFVGAVIAQFSSLNIIAIIALSGWAVFDSILLFTVFIISWFVRGWGSDLRIKSEEMHPQ